MFWVPWIFASLFSCALVLSVFSSQSVSLVSVFTFLFLCHICVFVAMSSLYMNLLPAQLVPVLFLIVPCLLLCWYSGKATHTFGAMSAAQTQAFRCMLYCECDKKNELKVHYVQFCFPCLFSQIQFSCALQVSPLCPFAFVYLNLLYCLFLMLLLCSPLLYVSWFSSDLALCLSLFLVGYK